jgi:hypothetical protein
MDVLNEDLLKFWEELRKQNVKYIMIGGFATRFHGYNRSTDDLDIWLDDTLINRQNLRKAFKNLGYGDYASIETMEFVPGWTSFYAAGIELDILTYMKGLEHLSFEDCYQHAFIATIENIDIPFLHIDHLILNKKAANGPKDQIDVIYLEKIKEIRDKEQ